MKQELREAVFNRDRYCVKCGRPLADPVAVHHRKLRKHGGPDALSNLVALCSPCHNIAPGSVHQNPADSYERGYLVKSWDDPSTAPLTLPNGRKVLLTDDGEYEYLEREGNEDGW
jgi:5-methylcytosine-specific restriction endonuclease McrA